MSDWLPLVGDADAFAVAFRGADFRFVRDGDRYDVEGAGTVRVRDVTFDDAGTRVHAAAFRWLVPDRPDLPADLVAGELVFLAVAPDAQLDPDVAVGRLEDLVAELRAAPDDRAAVVAALRARALGADDATAAAIDGVIADLEAG